MNPVLDLPFFLTLDFVGEMRGRLPDEVLNSTFCVVDEVVASLVLPYFHSDRHKSARQALAEAVGDYAKLREEAVEHLDGALGRKNLGALRRTGATYARTVGLRDAWTGKDADAFRSALADYDALAFYGEAPGPGELPDGADGLRTASERLDFCLSAIVSHRQGVVGAGIPGRLEHLCAAAKEAGAHARSLVLGALREAP